MILKHYSEAIDCTRHYIHCTVAFQTDSGGCTACHSTTGSGNGTSAGIYNTHHFSGVHTYIQWNPSNQHTLKQGHLDKQGHFLLSQMFMYSSTPANQDTSLIRTLVLSQGCPD